MDTSAAVNTAIGSVAVASLLLVYLLNQRKMSISEIADELLHTPYFHAQKKLGIKDEVIISMLESCQDKGPCYVITDPALDGKISRYHMQNYLKNHLRNNCRNDDCISQLLFCAIYEFYPTVSDTLFVNILRTLS